MSTARKIRLVTFASDGFHAQQAYLNKSARNSGVTEFAPWSEREIKTTDFYETHKAILDVKRGVGYWLWKPYIIRRELDSLKDGDFVLYYDVGRPSIPHRISRPLDPLLGWCERKNGGMLPGVYAPEYGRNAKWTKRECFILMGCDERMYWDYPQIQATYSVWQKSRHSETFVDEWLSWCCVPGMLADETTHPGPSNFPDFVDHRHDQSVVTNLALRRGVTCFGDPNEKVPGSKDINNLVDLIVGRYKSIALRNVRNFLRRQFNSRVLSK
jgi:hypothetical protein